MLNRRQALGASALCLLAADVAPRASAQAIGKVVHIVVGFPAIVGVLS